MAVTAYRLEPRDEYPHVPDDAPTYNESVYCNAFDHTQRVGGWMRLGNRVNEGYAELSVCLYLPGGRVACAFGRPEITTNERFDAGGLRITIPEPFERQDWRYDGELLVLEDPSVLRDPKRMFATAPRAAGLVEWSATAISPMHGGEPASPGEETPYGVEFSRAHFNQHVRTTGVIRVGDEEWRLEGFGWRDHSWGPRTWQSIFWYRLFMINLGTERGAMLIKRVEPSGRIHRVGTVLVDGAYEEITDLDVVTRWSPEKDPEGCTVTFATEQRAGVIEGRVITLAPLRNRREIGGELVTSRVAEGFTEWRWDDRTGYGMSEYVERLDASGTPVGWPL